MRRSAANRWTAGGVLVGLAVASGGCFFFGASPSWRSESPAATQFDPGVPMTSRAVAEGRLGGIYADRNDTATAEVSIAPMRSSSIRVDMEDTAQRRWVMTQVRFAGGLDLANIPVGSEYDSADPSTARSPLRVTSTLGCACPRRGSYTFDGPATHVAVRVEQGSRSDTRMLRIFTGYRGGDSVETQVEVPLQ